jgi:hypothetical protein
MRYRLTLVPLLGLVLPTLVALAHASPPDDTWLPGIYDDADFDDVVTFITLSSGAPPDAPAEALRPGSIAPSIIVPVESGVPRTRLRLPDDARSPPSSS